MFGIRARVWRRIGWRFLESGSYVASGVQLGACVHVARGAEIWREDKEVVEIGSHSFVLRGALLLPYGGSIRVGSRVGINPYSIIYGHGGVEIGNDVLIAAHTTIVAGNHLFDSTAAPIRSQGMSANGIRIEDDVWIGARTVIVDGVRIGRGAVVGAGAVVTRNVEPYQVVAGVPARVIRTRSAINVDG